MHLDCIAHSQYPHTKFAERIPQRCAQKRLYIFTGTAPISGKWGKIQFCFEFCQQTVEKYLVKIYDASRTYSQRRNSFVCRYIHTLTLIWIYNLHMNVGTDRHFTHKSHEAKILSRPRQKFCLQKNHSEDFFQLVGVHADFLLDVLFVVRVRSI